MSIGVNSSQHVGLLIILVGIGLIEFSIDYIKKF